MLWLLVVVWDALGAYVVSSSEGESGRMKSFSSSPSELEVSMLLEKPLLVGGLVLPFLGASPCGMKSKLNIWQNFRG